MSVYLGFTAGLTLGSLQIAGGEYFGNKIKEFTGKDVKLVVISIAAMNTASIAAMNSAVSQPDIENHYSQGYLAGVVAASTVATPVIAVLSSSRAKLKDKHIKMSMCVGALAGTTISAVTFLGGSVLISGMTKSAAAFAGAAMGSSGIVAGVCLSYYVAKKALNSQWFAKKCE